MRERIIGNWKTTIIGIPILLYALFITVCTILRNKVSFCEGCDYKVTEILIAWFAGWAFFTAKETLLTGMFGSIASKFLGIKKESDK
jgi:hypothetical protein